MTTEDLIDGILSREGAGEPPYYDGVDRGGRTRFGISERAHPEAWTNGPPTEEQARRIYRQHYVAPFAPLERIGVDDRVRLALIDDAVMAGVPTAVKTLQRLVGTKPDGILGPITVNAVQHVNGGGEWLLIRLVQARALRLARIVEQDHRQAKYIVGWLSRCLSFLG